MYYLDSILLRYPNLEIQIQIHGTHRYSQITRALYISNELPVIVSVRIFPNSAGVAVNDIWSSSLPTRTISTFLSDISCPFWCRILWTETRRTKYISIEIVIVASHSLNIKEASAWSKSRITSERWDTRLFLGIDDCRGAKSGWEAAWRSDILICERQPNWRIMHSVIHAGGWRFYVSWKMHKTSRK